MTDLVPPSPAQDIKGMSTSKSTGPVTWSIRGVERDTRSVIEKATKRAGKTLGQYINDDVRSFAQVQLTQSHCQRLRLTFRTRLTT